MSAHTPEELVVWCRRTLPDDTRAFEALVAQYKRGVFATAYRLMGGRGEAENRAQEEFLKIYRGVTKLERSATLPDETDPRHADWLTDLAGGRRLHAGRDE